MNLSTRQLVAFICVLLWLTGPPSGASAAGPAGGRLDVSCESCLVVDHAGRVLFERAARRELPMASTTKMMTALLVVERADLIEEVTVSAGAAATGGGGLALQAGEVWAVESLLHALLMSSSNDAAVALAEHVAGSEAAFVELMNERADAMGLSGTHFVTAHGLDMPDHHSTARDLAELGGALIEVPALAGIVAAPEALVDGPRGGVLLENRNLLLESYPEADGIKTGYTLGAGNVLVASARRGDRRLVAVAMRADDPFADARTMLDAGFALLRRTVLLEAGTEVASLVFDPAGSVGIAAAGPVRGTPQVSGLETVFEPSAGLTLPIEAGDVVGRLRVLSGSDLVGRVDARATGSLSADDRGWGTGALGTLLEWGHRLIGWAW
ncbi:MAG: D-alanyl-D-alanine carboxypeptidase family protein [Actinomycetota bacterium]